VPRSQTPGPEGGRQEGEPKPRGRKGGGKKGKKPKKLSCNQCCQRFVDTSGPKNKCACTPDTVACTQSAHCCSNNCVSGVCEPYGGAI
jgi:hypothetical protein